MHLNELEKRIEEDGPYEWVHPETITDISVANLKTENKGIWFCKADPTATESADEIIVDYLCECLMEQEQYTKKGGTVPTRLNVNGPMFVNAAIYLICNLGSSYAATHLSGWRELINTDNAGECIDILCGQYEISEPFVKDILRDFILDVFRFGPLWTPSEGIFSSSLSSEQNNSLKLIFEQGYATINNQDARLFTDGSRRI